MLDHAIFGGVLRSEIPFPELRPVECETPTWTFRTVADPAPLTGAEPWAEVQLHPIAWLRTYRSARGVRLDFDDTGIFDISSDGREITWWARPDASVELARLDAMGNVLSVALHLAGVLPLHGSAVSLQGGAIAFLAPQRHGKSTLALALLEAGGRLLTDDTLPVDPGPPVTAWPGVHSLRVWNDSAERLAAGHARTQGLAGKYVLRELPHNQLMLERVPLRAIYVLSPAEAGDLHGVPVRRTRLASAPAAMAILANSKVGRLLGRSESTTLFEHAVSLVERVPAYRLEVVRDFDRLREVVAQLLDWHGDTALEPALEPGARP